MAATQPIAYKERSHGVFENKHYMECPPSLSATARAGATSSRRLASASVPTGFHHPDQRPGAHRETVCHVSAALAMGGAPAPGGGDEWGALWRRPTPGRSVQRPVVAPPGPR